MSKPNIKDLMKQRNPLIQRATITPANLYSTGNVIEEKEKQGNKETFETITRLENVKQNVVKLKRYATYLHPKTIKKIKRFALDNDKKDYDIVQDALDKYLR